MKKKLFFLITLLAVLVCTLALAACKNDVQNTPVFTVRFNNNYDNTVTRVEVEEGQTVTLIQSPERAGYTFGGWYLSYECNAEEEFDASKPIYADITVFAKWERNANTSIVTLKYLNLVTEDSVIAVNNGTAVTKPADPVYDEYGSYVFDKWYTDAKCTAEYNFSGSVNGDITLYAGWTKVKEKVRFDANYPGAPLPEVKYAVIGEAVERPATPERAMYEFNNWYTERVGGIAFDFNSPITEQTTLYAHWLRSEYIVTFNVNGAQAEAGTTLKYIIKRNASAQEQADEVLSKLTYVGHDFGGWYLLKFDPDAETDISTDADKADLTAINDDATFFAKWTLQEYEVAFDYCYENAPAAPETVNVKYGKQITLPQAEEREGWMFVGWYTDNTFATQFTEDMAVTGNMTLCARWIENTVEQKDITVTYLYTANGNTVTSTKVVKFNSPASSNAPETPSVTDYYFAGWFTDDKFTSSFNLNANLLEDVTVYGRMLKKYTFEAEAVDLTGKVGFGSSTNSVEEGMIYSYTFIGDGTNTGASTVSNGWFIREMYYNGASISFDIEAKEDIKDAVLFLRVSSDTYEYRTTKEKDGKIYNYLSSSEFKIAVNADFDEMTGPSEWLNYGGLYMPYIPSQGGGDLESGKAPFEDCLISTTINLNKGYNTITLYVDNNNGHGGTFQAEAPMIDCIYIYASSELTMFDHEFYLKPNTTKGDL